MLALIIVASFVLPSVLGNCCSPDLYEAVMYTADEPNRARNVTVSHKDRKIMIKDLDTSFPLEFTLMDFNENVQYMKARNGKCQKVAIPTGQDAFFQQCTNKGKDVGSFTMGNGVNAVSFEFTSGTEVLHTVYSEDKCLPMVFVFHLDGGEVRTSVYGNMNYNNVDDSDLMQDLSSCV